MTNIIAFPQERALDAKLQRHIEAIQQIAADEPTPVAEAILAFLDQIQRTNASISAYNAQIETSRQNRPANSR